MSRKSPVAIIQNFICLINNIPYFTIYLKIIYKLYISYNLYVKSKEKTRSNVKINAYRL